MTQKENPIDNIPGDNNGEVTPVPIPNTEVKLSSADGTRTERSWESRSLPGFLFGSIINVGV